MSNKIINLDFDIDTIMVYKDKSGGYLTFKGGGIFEFHLTNSLRHLVTFYKLRNYVCEDKEYIKQRKKRRPK